MSDTSVRMTQPGDPPTDSDVATWLGNDAFTYWNQVEHLIDRRYPDVFVPEWLFGGKKHGWSRRYKKSKSFCTFIPEKNRFALLIVCGAKEREKVEAVHSTLSPYTRRVYDEARTYHDGKWLLLTVDNDEVVKDVMQLLEMKRKPKRVDVA